MKQIEEGLGTSLEQRLASAASAQPRSDGGGLAERGARCESSADCAHGVCISRACR